MANAGAWLRKVVLVYYQYDAVPGNTTQACRPKVRHGDDTSKPFRFD